MNLANRITTLEKRIAAAITPAAALIIFDNESEEAARERFTRERGFAPAPACKIIRFTVVDCSQGQASQ